MRLQLYQTRPGNPFTRNMFRWPYSRIFARPFRVAVSLEHQPLNDDFNKDNSEGVCVLYTRSLAFDLQVRYLHILLCSDV